MGEIFLCSVSVAPVRSQPSHRAEMVSQLLFGEAVEVLSENKDFLHIRCCHDGYTGWVQAGQVEAAPSDFASATEYSPAGAKIIAPENAFLLSMGSPVYPGHRIRIGSTDYKYDLGEVKAGLVDHVKTAALFLNTPYLWGGRSSFGIDCSGLVQQVFRMHGQHMPRDSSEQALCGDDVGFLSEVRAGDLAFFDNEDGRIIHVGILLGSDRIIHASGRVRVDPIDSHGIINSRSLKRSHRLRTIKRVQKKADEI